MLQPSAEANKDERLIQLRTLLMIRVFHFLIVPLALFCVVVHPESHRLLYHFVIFCDLLCVALRIFTIMIDVSTAVRIYGLYLIRCLDECFKLLSFTYYAADSCRTA